MPPKLTEAKFDGKLHELRSYVVEHQTELSARRDTTLAKTLKQNKTREETHWYQFLNKRSDEFTPEQIEHVQETFAILRQPHVISAATAASSSTVPAIAASTINEAESAVSRSEIITSRLKRKRSENTSTVSSAIPPTRELTMHHWAELHDFKDWLQTPQAEQRRKKRVHADRQTINDLMIWPPKQNKIILAAKNLEVKSIKRSPVAFHYECVKKALELFRWWRHGGFPGMCRNMDSCNTNSEASTEVSVTNIEAAAEICARKDYSWTTTLTRTWRKCTALASNDEWKNMLALLQLLLKSTNQRSVRRMVTTRKDLIKAIKIPQSRMSPRMVITSDGQTRDSAPRFRTSEAIIHYQCSCFCVNQAERFAHNLEKKIC